MNIIILDEIGQHSFNIKSMVLNLKNLKLVEEFDLKEVSAKYLSKKHQEELILILGQKKQRITINFTNSEFSEKLIIDNVKINELILDNVVLKKGASFSKASINKVIYKLNTLEESVYFKDIKIKKFEYKTPKRNTGKLYFNHVDFIKKADFRNKNLDGVHFISMDMINVYLLNSDLSNAYFYGCKFSYLDNKIVLRDKYYFLLPLMAMLFFIYMFKNNENIFLLSLPIVLITVPLFNNYIYQHRTSFLSNLIKKIFHLEYTKIGKHLAITDEISIFKDKSNINKVKVYQLKDVYKSIRNSMDKSGEYQTSGDFHYSQKVIELSEGSRYKQYFEKIIENTSYLFTGFAERPIVPLSWIIIILLGFGTIYKPNVDFIYTKHEKEEHQYYLMTDNNLSDVSKYYFSINSINNIFKKDTLIIQNTKTAILYGSEGLVLWFLIAAFIFSIKNRTRRHQ